MKRIAPFLLLSACAGDPGDTWIAVARPESFPVDLSGIAHATVATVQELDAYGWQLADKPEWGAFLEEDPTRVKAQGTFGVAIVLLSPDELDCVDIAYDGLPYGSRGLIVVHEWWSDPGENPGWTGVYPQGSGVRWDDTVARVASVGMWDGQTVYFTENLTGAAELSTLDDTSGSGTLDVDVLGVDALNAAFIGARCPAAEATP